MPTFVKSVFIRAPIETVFRFHKREDALQLLSPSFPPVRVVHKTGGIEIGSLVQLKVGPFDWVALHSAFEDNRYFEDQQISGPFRQWIHSHEFEKAGEATRLTDRIEYEIFGGPTINYLFGWVMKLGLHQMFRHRHQITKRYCEK